MTEPTLTLVPKDWFYHEIAYVRGLEAALKEIISIKADMFGPRAQISAAPRTPPRGQEDFDRGCRIAFYRCAEIAQKALALGERER